MWLWQWNCLWLHLSVCSSEHLSWLWSRVKQCRSLHIFFWLLSFGKFENELAKLYIEKRNQDKPFNCSPGYTWICTELLKNIILDSVDCPHLTPLSQISILRLNKERSGYFKFVPVVCAWSLPLPLLQLCFPPETLHQGLKHLGWNASKTLLWTKRVLKKEGGRIKAWLESNEWPTRG